MPTDHKITAVAAATATDQEDQLADSDRATNNNSSLAAAMTATQVAITDLMCQEVVAECAEAIDHAAVQEELLATTKAATVASTEDIVVAQTRTTQLA